MPAVAVVGYELSNGSRLYRCIEYNSFLELMDNVKDQESMITSKFETLKCTRLHLHKPCAKMVNYCNREELTFTHICGKIMHVHYRSPHRDGVKHSLKRTVNGFGRFNALYTIHCNLLTSNNNQNTLFRAGSCSADIQNMIDIAIDESNIQSIHVHLIIANARLGRVIHHDSIMLDNAFSASKDWTTNTTIYSEDMTYNKGIKIHSFKDTWFRAQFNLDIQTPISILMNISKTGNVNIFLNLAQDTVFFVGVEDTVKPIFQFFIDFILFYTGRNQLK